MLTNPAAAREKSSHDPGTAGQKVKTHARIGDPPKDDGTCQIFFLPLVQILFDIRFKYLICCEQYSCPAQKPAIFHMITCLYFRLYGFISASFSQRLCLRPH